MYEEWVTRMNTAGKAGDRKAVVAEMCRIYGVSAAKAYAMLKEGGWDSGRKPRKDSGSTGLSKDQLQLIAGMLEISMRKNGKQSLPANVARSIAMENGFDIPVGNSRLRSLMRQYNLTITDTKAPAPHQQMRSEYPNQVHCADPSVSLLWFSPGGKQKIVGDDEHYKNKDFYGDDKLKCWRYVLTDHYSASLCVRYYAALAETAENMYDFLLYAWGMKQNPLYAFHGLPKMLIWDKGSANKAKSVTRALTALRVEADPHLPGNPRAKGQVEEANNLVETHFESRLRFEPVRSIDALNDAAERWCTAYNADMIAGEDCRLTRNRIKVGSRLMLWQKIKPEQLRELPDPDICRQIFTADIQRRKVGGDLAISIVHPKVKRSLRYSVAHFPGILVGQEVIVQPVLVDPKARVAISYKFEGKPVSYEVEPIEYNEAGFDLTAPVFGREYKRPPDTLREKNARELEKLAAGPVPFAGITGGEGLKAHSFINAASPFIKQRTGEQITIAQPDHVEIHDILVSHFEAAKQVKARNGWLSDSFISRMKAAYPEGVPSSLIDDIAHDEAGQETALSM
jgi:transposase InsO family protein